jgi:hypothetical protein
MGFYLGLKLAPSLGKDEGASVFGTTPFPVAVLRRQSVVRTACHALVRLEGCEVRPQRNLSMHPPIYVTYLNGLVAG